MSHAAKYYIAGVVCVGLLLLAGCLIRSWQPVDALRFESYLGVATLASTFKIRLPGMEGSISLNFMMYLICIGARTLTETVLMASVATLVQALWRPKTKPTAVKILFNVSALLISVTGAYFASRQMHLTGTQVPALVIAATVLFVLNSWLVSIVIALTTGASLTGIWRNCNRWTFTYYMMGAGVAVMVIAYSRVVGWSQALALLPAAYLIYVYCDGYIKREREAHA